MTRKWIKVNDLSKGQCSTNKNIRFKIPMLRSDLCDISHPYIVLKRTIKLKTGVNDNMLQKDVALKNTVPFCSCIKK